MYQAPPPGAEKYNEQDTHTGQVIILHQGRELGECMCRPEFCSLQCWEMVTAEFLFGPLNVWDFRAGAATSPFLQGRLWGRGRGGYPSKLRQQSEAWETQPGWLLGRSSRSNPTSHFTHVSHAKEMGRDVFKIRHLSPTTSSSSNSLSYPSLSPLPLRAVSCR